MKWEKYCLEDIIHIKHGYAFKGEFFSEEPTDDILLTPGNFNIGGGFKSQKLKFYNGEFPIDYILDENDVIVTMTDLSKEADTLGYSAKVPAWSGKRFLHNQRIGLVSLKTDKFDLNYLYWLMRTYSYQRFVANGATGATVKHTSPAKICAYTFNAPKDKTIQSRIASILSAYEYLIENNLKRIKLLEEKALFGYWQIVKEEHLSEILLSEIADVNKESIGTQKQLDTLLYVDISSVTPGLINDKKEYDFKDAPGRARRIVKHQDIIWSCVRPNRKSYSIIWHPENNLIVSTGFAVISVNDVSPLYFYHCLTSDEFVQYLEKNATGAAYPAVTAKDFEKAKIKVPKESIREKYQMEVEPIFEFKYLLQKQNTILSEARDLLLPRLMNGQIEV